MNKNTAIMLTGLLCVSMCFSCGANNKTSEGTNLNEPSEVQPSDPVYVEDYPYTDETTYTGYMVNGLPDGQGVLTFFNTNCVYTGEFRNGVYHGEGLFEWKNDGNKLEGTFLDGHPVRGRFTYQNTMNYVGEFNEDWQFHGRGTFDWNTYNPNGSVKAYGWLYEGEFRNGTIEGCIGKITFTDERAGRKTEGILWFEGEMSGFPAIKINQFGRGAIRYGDRSVYVGGLYHTSNDYLRYGKGEQDFSECNIGVEGAWGVARGEYLYKYVGDFDYTKSGWIYGNGVLYYKDIATKQPKRWSKGYFSACHILKEYDGEDITLEEGFTNDMESKFLRFREDYDKYMARDGDYEVKHHKFLFVGDSYMEFMNSQPDTPFSKYFGEYDAINVGCGGSTTADWLNYYEDLILPYTPEYIVMHIGGNDLSNGSNMEIIVSNIEKLLNNLAKDMPETKIIMVLQTPNIVWKTDWAQRKEINNHVLALKEIHENLLTIDLSSYFFKDEATLTLLDNAETYYRDDKLHLSDKGYLLWSSIIKETLSAL